MSIIGKKLTVTIHVQLICGEVVWPKTCLKNLQLNQDRQIISNLQCEECLIQHDFQIHRWKQKFAVNFGQLYTVEIRNCTQEHFNCIENRTLQTISLHF